MSFGQRVVVGVLCATAAGIATPLTVGTAAAVAVAALSFAVLVESGGVRRMWLSVALASLSAAHAADDRDRILAAPLTALLDSDRSASASASSLQGVLV